ncbi:MAG: hypothetical protein AAF449_12040, partial [Myxococcota bacterium]
MVSAHDVGAWADFDRRGLRFLDLSTVRADAEAAVDRTMYYDEPFRAFEYNGGIHVTDSVLWCDTDRRNDLVFISHSHADYVGKNRRILATDKTVRMLTRGTGKIDALTSPYRRQFTLGPLALQMFPSGHVLGAAQLLI